MSVVAATTFDDPAVSTLIEREAARQDATLNMVAAKSTAPAAVLRALGSVFNNKPAEGYPGRRYHRGCEIADELEELAVARATELFGAGHANVQPHSGRPGECRRVCGDPRARRPGRGMDLRHGGHLSHGASASITGAFYDFRQYGVRADTELIDYDQVRDVALEHRPRLIVAGGSSYPRVIDYALLRSIADEVGAPLARRHVAHLGLGGRRRPPRPGPARPVVTSDHVQDAPWPARRDRPLRRRARERPSIARSFPGPRGHRRWGRSPPRPSASPTRRTGEFHDIQQATVDNAAARRRPGRRRLPIRFGRDRQPPGPAGPAGKTG